MKEQLNVLYAQMDSSYIQVNVSNNAQKVPMLMLNQNHANNATQLVKHAKMPLLITAASAQ